MTMTEKSNSIVLGVSSRTINPPLGLWLIGYPNPFKRANTGVAMDLCARAAIFALPGAQTCSAAMVVLDTMVVPVEVVARIRQMAAERIPGLTAESLMVAATHTHSAPTF